MLSGIQTRAVDHMPDLSWPTITMLALDQWIGVQIVAESFTTIAMELIARRIKSKCAPPQLPCPYDEQPHHSARQLIHKCPPLN